MAAPTLATPQIVTIDAQYAANTLPSRVRLSLNSFSVNRSKRVRITWRLDPLGVVKRGTRVSYLIRKPGEYIVNASVTGIRGVVVPSKRISISTSTGPLPTPTSAPTPAPEVTQCSGATNLTIDFSQTAPTTIGTLTGANEQSGRILPITRVAAPPTADDSVLLQLNFDDPTQPGKDNSALGIPLGCTGNACPTVIAGGRLGSAGLFSGGQGLVTPLTLARNAFTDQDFSWAFWFKTRAADSQALLGSYCGYGHFSASLTLINGQISLGVDPANANGAQVRSTRTDLADDTWHHVVAVRQARTGLLRLYIDGVLDKEAVGPVNGGSITCGTIGIGMTNGSFPVARGFRGSLDAVTLYDRALDEQQVSRLARGTVLTGIFTSRVLTLSAPAYRISGSIVETAPGISKLEISTDSTTWCPLDSQGNLNDPACALPSRTISYRATIRDVTELQRININTNCTPTCIDRDGDGASSIPSNIQLCAIRQLDCNDENEFLFPNNKNPSCTCTATRTPESCGDGIDNDCDGAIDADDSDCSSGNTIYYVSSSQGRDANSGLTPGSPIRSIEVAQAILSGRVKAGDKILLKRGDTWKTGAFSLQKSGTEERRIVIGSYGEGERPQIQSSVEGNVISLRNAHYVTIKDLHITRSDLRTGVVGIGFDSQVASNSVTLDTIHLDRLSYGMLVHGSNFLLQNSIVNDCENSQVAGAGHSQGLWVYDGSERGIVRNNTFSNNGKYRVMFDHNVYLGGGNNWLFEGNEFSGDSGTSIVFHGDQSGHIIRGNVFRDNTANPAVDISNYSAGHTLRNILVERNKFLNNRGGGFWIREAVDLTVRNNLFVNNGTVFAIAAAPAGSTNETTGFLAEHNTFYGNSSLFSVSAPGVFTLARNILDSGPIRVGSDASIVQIENLPGTVDARFVNPVFGNFRLLSGSPAIDAGSPGSTYDDIDGFSRPIDGDLNGTAQPDLGAYEFRP